MAVITAEMKVGDIARTWPETMKVFMSYGLDLCCGGVHPLEFAARKHGFDLNTILAQLNEAAGTPAAAKS